MRTRTKPWRTGSWRATWRAASARAAIGAALALALPGAARACSMCIAAQNDSVQTAFAVASLFMSVTPLAVIGGCVWYLRRRAQKLAAEEAAGVIHLPLAADRAPRRP